MSVMCCVGRETGMNDCVSCQVWEAEAAWEVEVCREAAAAAATLAARTSHRTQS